MCRASLLPGLVLGVVSCSTGPQPPHLVFTVVPTAVAAGQPIQPAIVVTAEDAGGHVATSYSDQVTIGFGANPGGGVLSGTLTQQAVAGAATFPGLVIDSSGTGYTLVASAGRSSITSAGFVVGSTGIVYHGGPVIVSPKVAALYWSSSVIYNGGPEPGTSGNPSSADQSLIAFFLNHVGGSPYYNITTTYYDSAAFVQNVVTYTQYWADTDATTYASYDVGIQDEIENGFANGKLTYDPSTVYLVFSGTGVNLGGAFGVTYCAYHSWFVDGLGRNVVYAALPYANDFKINSLLDGCSDVSAFGTPNDDSAADGEIDLIAHEVAESITDKNVNAWYTSGNNGQEMADLCQGMFGTWSSAPNGAKVNETFGGKSFLVQTLWVNAVNDAGQPVGCQQGWTSAAAARARPPIVVARGAPLPQPHVMRLFRAR